MSWMLKAILRIVLGLTLIVSLVSCSEDNMGGDTIPSTGGGSPVTDTPVGTVEGTGFWVNLTNTNNQFSYIVHKDGEFGEDCFIDVDSTTNELLTCNIDLMEGDLYMRDLEIQYNAPPELCDHVRVATAWHWNQSVGVGPSEVEVDVYSNPVTGLSTVTGCTSVNSSSATINCSANIELEDVANTAGPRCVYDKSSSGGVNCCFGNYTLTVNTNDGTSTSTVVTNTTWGGDVLSCLGGLPRTSWTTFSASGYPAAYVQSVPKSAEGVTAGLNDVFKLEANAVKPNARFSIYANHYETQGTPHSHDGYLNPAVSTKPYAFEPIDDLDGSAVPSASDAYTITCLDSAFEIKHMIKIYIREWNTLLDFIAFQDTEGATYNPDQTGLEGTNCDYDGTFGDECNDFSDFADILTGAGGTYTTTPGAGAAAARATYFPQVSY